MQVAKDLNPIRVPAQSCAISDDAFPTSSKHNGQCRWRMT
jgi:hypothetical protein